MLCCYHIILWRRRLENKWLSDHIYQKQYSKIYFQKLYVYFNQIKKYHMIPHFSYLVYCPIKITLCSLDFSQFSNFLKLFNGLGKKGAKSANRTQKRKIPWSEHNSSISYKWTIWIIALSIIITANDWKTHYYSLLHDFIFIFWFIFWWGWI